jgi:hypothetical protein
MSEEPQNKRRGWLKNGNPPGDYSKAPRCGARTKSRGGAPCQCPAMPNGRCRVHGGRSTGPRTREGIERIRQARTKHGFYSAPMRAIRAESRATMRILRDIVNDLANQ